MKLKIKETYLILLIVISLISLGVYSTYALFTASTEISDVVGITATLDIGKSISEYEIVNVVSGETKLIELNVVNSSSNTIYYGAWYKIVEGNSEDIELGLYTDVNSNTSSGTLSSSASINLLVGITNNSDSNITVYLGVKGSNTNELNLGSDKTLLPTGWTEGILVTDEVLEANKVLTIDNSEVNKTYSYTGSVQTDVLEPGTYKLEVWGASGAGGYTTKTTTSTGGNGGYSYGTLTLSEDTNIYIYVGGAGMTPSGTSESGTGGFNGGGTTTKGGGTGGGASDIRLNSDSLYSRVIVAGGGGGGNAASGSSFGSSVYIGNGGYGGGESGGAGDYSTASYNGSGGTQTAGGATGTYTLATAGTAGDFGTGGNGGAGTSLNSYGAGSGGGGWYGGGGGTGARGGAGGGSGYVYTESTYSNYPSDSLLNSSYYLTNAATVAGNTSFTDYDGSTVTGHSGNGYVKISGNKNITNISYNVPQLKGLTTLNIVVGQSTDLTSNLELICENNQMTGCSITSVSITDTSILEFGTHIVTYKVTGVDNKKYLFNRTINVKIKANSPDLVDGLIPVTYNESTSSWVKADSTNINNSWYNYDYDNKIWANAALVSETNRSTYQSASAGTTITKSDILAFYVWIPRYKYKVWNINKVIGTDSYSAQTTGIDIIFESGTNSTGTIECEYSYAEASSTTGSPNEVCTGSNGDYYTHPAFTFGSDELRGFWIGKFELTGSSSSLTILPNLTSLRDESLSSFSTLIQNMQKYGNIYGLSTSRTNTDSHMLTNYEWGAVAYLTNSNYGRCDNGTCTKVTVNNNGSFITGFGGDTVSASPGIASGANVYNEAKGMLASTTGNVSGVYDMSGGSWEYTMGNTSSVTESYTFYPSSSDFVSTWYSTDNNSKYVTTYAYDGSNYNNQTAYNRGRLGDATGEVVSLSNYAWYNNYAIFPSSSNAWFIRGGDYNTGSNTGVFRFAGFDGGVYLSNSSRAALISLSN